MKVLHVIGSLGVGGAEKLLLDTIPRYNQEGIVSDILLLKTNKEPFLQSLLDTGSCKVYSLNQKSVYNPLGILKIGKYLKNYNIIHVHLFPAQFFVPIAKVLRNSKCKLLLTEHSTNNKRRSSFLLKHIDKFIYKAYDRIVCITPKVYELTKVYTGLKPSNFIVISNGVDINKIKIAKPLNLKEIDLDFKESNKYLLQVSSFHEPKDHFTLIKSLNYLPENYKLLLAGNGIDKIKSEQLVKTLKLNNRVHFLGSRQDIPSLIKSVDVIVLSSKFEGLSLSSIEAMASGKPFIASSVPGLKDIVEDAGVLFEQGNSKYLAYEIEKLINNEIYRNEVVKACLERAKKYDISLMVEKHKQLYYEVYN